MTSINIEEALVNPSAVFKEPEAVLKAKISLDNKIAILNLWEHDLHLLQMCDEENMSGPDISMLRRIHQCLTELKDSQQKH